MLRRRLGRSDATVSAIGLGTVKFGGSTPDDECERILREALDRGIDFIDTAHAYGRSEEIIGGILSAAHLRERAFLCTKIQPMKNDRATILEQTETSLRRLKTDRIDLLLLHRPNPEIPIAESLEALDQLVKQGKVRFIGSSGFKAWQLMEALWTSGEARLASFSLESSVYSLLCRWAEVELIPMLQTAGMGLSVWSPLGAGVLSDRYSRDNPPAHAELTEREWAVLETVQSIARNHGCTASQVALAWCLGQPGVTTVLAGPRTLDQLRDNLGALDISLSEDDLRKLDDAAPPGWTARPSWLGLATGAPHFRGLPGD
jgi:aryl-alcohol dehydrogenase-like predicted oxidoreductase